MVGVRRQTMSSLSNALTALVIILGIFTNGRIMTSKDLCADANTKRHNRSSDGFYSYSREIICSEENVSVFTC